MFNNVKFTLKLKIVSRGIGSDVLSEGKAAKRKTPERCNKKKKNR